MKTIPVTIEIPIDLISEAIVPLVVGEILQQDQSTHRVLKRAPLEALLEAVQRTANAVTHFENQEFTRAERDASARVVSAAKGLRKAFKAQQIEEKSNGK